MDAIFPIVSYSEVSGVMKVKMGESKSWLVIGSQQLQ